MIFMPLEAFLRTEMISIHLGITLKSDTIIIRMTSQFILSASFIRISSFFDNAYRGGNPCLKFPHKEVEKLSDAFDWFASSEFYIEVSVIYAGRRSV